jgi:nitrate/nitrite transport system permease protein
VTTTVSTGSFLIVWQLLSAALGVARLPGPINVLIDTWDPYISQPFFDDGGTSKGLGWQILISLQRVAVGYGLAAMVGIAIGGFLGLNRFAGKGFDPVVQVLRTVPPLAWFPISLMVFQDANISAIFVIFITAIWPIIINTAVGIQQIPQDYTNVARVLRLSKRAYIRSIVVPATVPYVFTGLRIAVGLPGWRSWRRRCSRLTAASVTSSGMPTTPAATPAPARSSWPSSMWVWWV